MEQPVAVGSAEFSPEQMTRFLEGVKEPYKEHEEEKRRGLQITAGFFEKLSALNAGSIALGASIILAVVVKPDVNPDVSRTILHEILKVVVLLWISLVLAIFHNFLAAVVAQLEAAYSGTDFVLALMKLTLSIAREAVPIDDATALQVETAMQVGLHPKRKRLAKSHALSLSDRKHHRLCVNGLSIVAAYTLVMVYLLKLW